MKSNKLNYLLNCKWHFPDKYIQEQVTFLQKKLGYDKNFTKKIKKSSLKFLKNAGYVFLYMSFCFKEPTGLQLLSDLVVGKDKKNKMIVEAVHQVHESHFKEVLANMSKLEEENRFYNWYLGYTRVAWPYWDEDYGLDYYISTSATTGSVKTQHFGDGYDPDKIERKLRYYIKITPPEHVVGNPNYTLTLEIEKVIMFLPGSSVDFMFVGDDNDGWQLDADQNYHFLKFTAPAYIYILVRRDVNEKDIETNQYFLKKNPGFNMKWNYNQRDIKPDTTYKEERLSIFFRR